MGKTGVAIEFLYVRQGFDEHFERNSIDFRMDC